MTDFRQPPRRHWRSYGTEPLPTPAEAMAEPFSAFPSWFLRVECDRCGKPIDAYGDALNAAQRDLPLRDIIARMRHDGCGGRAGKVELLTGVEGASSRPVRKIVLRADCECHLSWLVGGREATGRMREPECRSPLQPQAKTIESAEPSILGHREQADLRSKVRPI